MSHYKEDEDCLSPYRKSQLEQLEKRGNMEDYLREENAKLREQLAERNKLLEAKHYYNGGIGARQLREIDALRQRAEAAEAKLKDWTRRSESCESKLGQLEANEQVMILEAKLKAASEQEPVAWAYGVSSGDMYGITMYKDDSGLEPLYAAPIPPADAQELEEATTWKQQSEFLHKILLEETKLKHEQITKAREEGRKEAVPYGWQVVPKEPSIEILEAMNNGFSKVNLSDAHTEYGVVEILYYEMLEAAPTPGEKE